MRIAHLTSVHGCRDVRIYRKMCRSLAAAGHEVHLVVPCEETDCAGLDAGIIVHPVPRPRNRRTRMLLTTRQVWATAAAVAADVYHLHDPELLRTAVRWQRRLARPVIYDAHEDIRDAVLDKHWIPKSLRRPLRLLAGAVEDWSTRRLAAVVAATPTIARRFSKHAHTVVINNYPLREALAQQRPEPSPASGSRFAYVGGITDIRGTKEMIQALPLAGGDVRLAMAGNWLHDQFREECQRLPGASQVDDMGFLSPAEVQELFATSLAGLVVFHPARNHVNAQPNKMFEYMAAGLPVIASDFPLWRSILEEAGCGLLVNPRDPKAIAAAMRWIVEHPDEARSMGQRGRRAVVERYHWDREVPKLLSLYEHLVADGRWRRPNRPPAARPAVRLARRGATAQVRQEADV